LSFASTDAACDSASDVPREAGVDQFPEGTVTGRIESVKGSDSEAKF
jgi:hypothetical protein